MYSSAQVRALDRYAIDTGGVPGYVLMQRAAQACWREVLSRWPEPRRCDVFCGSGNNGGDGYEIARLARAAGWDVRVWQLGEPTVGTEAEQARHAWLEVGNIEAWQASSLLDSGLIVDAIFGTGLSRPGQGMAREAIAAINARPAGLPVVAVDIPSGLSADTGAVQGVAVKAELTVSFIGRKLGLYTGDGPEFAGERVFDSLGVEPDPAVNPAAALLQSADLQRWLPKRPRSAHKGDHGHVLLIGGDHGMAGAILLAARAALRAGAGLVSVATRSAHAAVLAAAQAEAMFRGVEDVQALLPLLERADVVAIGPGLGRDAWGRQLWAAVRELALPKVVDADALNLLAAEPIPGHWVITPHPGEAARLLACSVAEIQRDRAGAAAALQLRYGGTAVLKGAGTLIAGGSLAVCPYGNPGMGVGGMGDVLTGVVAAFIAQGLALDEAASAAVLAHALAGDAASSSGERGLLPSDLLQALRRVINP